MVRVIGIGDNVCDKYYPSMVMYPGGQALNVAVYAKMLGAESAYMGVFGSDRVADHVRAVLDEIGIDRSRCRQYDGENGCAKVRLIDGDRTFIGSNKGGISRERPLELDGADLDYIGGFDIVHTSNNGHFDGQLAKVRLTGIPISYDFSWHWNEPYYLDEVASRIDYAFFSCGASTDDEAESACRRFTDRGCRCAVATLGSRGAVLFDGTSFLYQPPHFVEAVDTLGAGDSFAAAFLVAMLEGRTAAEAMEAGAEFSSRTCCVRGAFGHGVPFEE